MNTQRLTVPFVPPTPNPSQNPGLRRLFEALSEAQHPERDPDYPPHDEERFQEGYPRKGDGKYGSPWQF